jgi:hypothetical protein
MRSKIAASVLLTLLMGCQSISSSASENFPPVDTTGWAFQEPSAQTPGNHIRFSQTTATKGTGWSMTGKPTLTPTGFSAEPNQALTATVQNEQPLSAPIQATYTLNLTQIKEWANLYAAEPAPASDKPATASAAKTAAKAAAISFMVQRSGDSSLYFTCMADGKPMDAVIEGAKSYQDRYKTVGTASYSWRFPATKNLWNPRDRAEIGASYQDLAPFSSKTFVVKLIVLPNLRQIWIDDRLVAQAALPAPASVKFGATLRASAFVSSISLEKPQSTGRFNALTLGDLFTQPNPGTPGVSAIEPATKVPFRVPAPGAAPIDLSKSLYRYRLTHGTGPNAPYVNASRAWGTGLEIDPAEASLRVPFKPYQNVWVVASIDSSDPNAVPAGTLRFYKGDAGYPAMSHFEITPNAISKGIARKLSQTTPEGKTLYLVKVPVDTNALYGLSDQKNSVIDFQITKPVQLNRSYPDPIYFGYHPAGLASSLKVYGITLEEAPFDYDVKPAAFAHTFEQPEKILYDIPVTNSSSAPLDATVTLATESYDKSETQKVKATITVAPGATSPAQLDLSSIKKLGWHKLDITVSAGGVTRTNTLALVVLPKNTRTYGTNANEIRFGVWELLGHYTPSGPNQKENDRILELFRKLGMRWGSPHTGFYDLASFPKYDLLPGGPHTIVALYHRHKENDPDAVKKMLDDENKNMVAPSKLYENLSYYYGGEWYYDHVFPYGPNPRYTGQGPYKFDEKVDANIKRQIKIFTDIGTFMRKNYPKARLTLQWGGPALTVGFMEYNFPKDLVDAYGMDAPMFELTPELPTGTGTINGLWGLRAEAKRMGWPQLPIAWCEGPFLNTNPGALTYQEQEENYIRYYMHGLAYGIDRFEAGMVPFDAGNYYGAEHYGAGVYERIPLVCPKPAVAAINTATTKLCGAETIGPVDTGVLTTCAMSFKNAKGQPMYCLWRTIGSVQATLAVTGSEGTVTDAMGNPVPLEIKDGKAVVTLSGSPIWVEGVNIKSFSFGAPVYEEKPAPIAKPLAKFAKGEWSYDGAPQLTYETNHFGTYRTSDKGVSASFAETGADKATVTLALQPQGDRPLAIRYGSIVPKTPITIPGKASALGLWIDGNSSWGRVIYQLKDAKGEIWTSVGTKNDWNCDDSHSWSYVKHEGKRYSRFPLPSNAPYDKYRELESTWWKHEHGDGIVDLPLSVDRIIVETRNESLYLGQLRLVKNRSYALSGLVAEYAQNSDATDDAVAHNQITMPPVEWVGPTYNPMTKLAESTVPAPSITKFDEPVQFNDGRNMIIHFTQEPATTYKLYISTFQDGRGAELFDPAVTDGKSVRGFQPALPVYLFLTKTGADKIESKPSAAFKVVTEDKFAEK